MTTKEHKERHILLHKALDELIADFKKYNDKPIFKATIKELMEWSFNQTLLPQSDQFEEEQE